jgi:hypothetical protein
MSSAFSIEYLSKRFCRKNPGRFRVWCFIFAVPVIFLIFFYTRISLWKKIKLYHYGLDKEFQTASPANQYLHPDDLRIFKTLKKNTFLAPPWKGTVLGIATDNYPLTVKSGTITISPLLYPEFMNASADEKVRLAERFGIQYVYSHPFYAAGFTLIGRSEEGLSLYSFEKNNK